MDTYIIRVHLREESNPHTLTGSVEEPGIRGKKGFVNLEQLWDILNSRKKKQSKLRRKIEVFDKGRDQVGR